jgi:hypothetical protein
VITSSSATPTLVGVSTPVTDISPLSACMSRSYPGLGVSEEANAGIEQ